MSASRRVSTSASSTRKRSSPSDEPADTLARIRARGHIGIRLGLDRMEALLGRLGEPQRALRGVLIGGTNGKGSVAAMVASILAVAGYATGQSPSPHLHSYRERVMVDGQPIDEADLDSLLAEVLAASEPGEERFGPATEFELLTAAAYLWSARRGVDVMVMEVGLGGRLDASNTWHAQVAAVTNVGLDHQEYLGHTLSSIAAEKAAIIKPGARAVTGAGHGPALAVLRRHARAMRSPLRVCRPLDIETMDSEGLVLVHPRLGVLRVPLLGRHQAANVAVAVAVIEELASAGVASVPDDAVRRGLANVSWPGRLELIERDGHAVILDGAHNPDGMATLAATMDALAPFLAAGRATLVLAVMRDKEVAEMLARLAASPRLADACCLTTVVPGTERSLPADDLARHWREATGREAVVVDDADAALERALEIAHREGGPVIVAGSLYLVGALRATLVPGVIRDRDA